MVGVPGVTRLAQHTICWNGYQSSRRAPHGPEMQNTSSSCWFTTTAAVRSIDWSQEAVTESTDETRDSYLSVRTNGVEMWNRRTHYPRKAHGMESQVDHRQKNRVVRAEDQSYCDDQPGKAELQSGTRTITCQGWRNQFQ